MDVSSHVERGLDIGRYHTWAWAPPDALPESAGILTGQPVYTVYLAVPGSRREWIMQFAVPGAREPVRQRTSTSIWFNNAGCKCKWQESCSTV